MARFRLTGKHYLKVSDPPCEWEQKEWNQTTGKQARKVYPVPMYLDPDNPGDCNYPGEIIVATKREAAYPRDIIFIGLPTTEMEPLDPEATKLSTEAKKRGEHPIESLPANGP
jgi:hypothetical protein